MQSNIRASCVALIVDNTNAGSLGVADLMSEEISSHEELNALQRKDLTAIGRLLLMLGCCSTAPSMDALASTYSESFVRAVSALLASVQGTSFSSWQQVSPDCACAWEAGMHVTAYSRQHALLLQKCYWRIAPNVGDTKLLPC